MQLPGGGFSLWPGGTEAHPWAGTYAAHFLVEARKAGHPVDETTSTTAPSTGWAARSKAKSAYGHDDLQRTVYGLYVLARAGRADLGTMDHIRTKHGKDLRPRPALCSPPPTPRSGNPEGGAASWSRASGRASKRSSARPAATSTRRSATARCCCSRCSTPRRPTRASRPSPTGWAATPGRPASGRPRRRASPCSPSGQLAHRQAKLPPYSGSGVRGRQEGRHLHQPDGHLHDPPGRGGRRGRAGAIRIQMDGTTARRRLLQSAHPRRPDRRGLQGGQQRPGDRARSSSTATANRSTSTSVQAGRPDRASRPACAASRGRSTTWRW